MKFPGMSIVVDVNVIFFLNLGKTYMVKLKTHTFGIKLCLMHCYIVVL